MMVFSAFLATALLAAAGDFDLQTLDGQSATGRIVELAAEAVTLETPRGRATFKVDSLATLTRHDDDAPDFKKPTLWVELLDQSGIGGTEYTVLGESAQIKLTNGRTLELSTKAIRWVRFTPPGDRDAKLAEQWADITQAKATGDLLVLRKSGALDYQEGVQQDVETEICKFELDGEAFKVPRGRVEGIVYFAGQERERPEPIGTLLAADGSRLSMRSASLEQDAVQLETPGGIRVSWPLAEVSRIDFSSGKIAYLSDLEPESATFAAYLPLKEDRPTLRDYYRYRRDVGFEQIPLRLDGTTYGKGLSLYSRTLLAYKLPGKYRLFKAVVGVDDSVRETGNVRVEIRGDGKLLWQAEVRGSDSAQPVELEIAGVKRLEILADYGEDQDTGDRLDLADARVTK